MPWEYNLLCLFMFMILILMSFPGVPPRTLRSRTRPEGQSRRDISFYTGGLERGYVGVGVGDWSKPNWEGLLGREWGDGVGGRVACWHELSKG